MINEVCLQPDLNESEQQARRDEYVIQTPQIPFGQSLQRDDPLSEQSLKGKCVLEFFILRPQIRIST